jgi:hypothetical protein
MYFWGNYDTQMNLINSVYGWRTVIPTGAKQMLQLAPYTHLLTNFSTNDNTAHQTDTNA